MALGTTALVVMMAATAVMGAAAQHQQGQAQERQAQGQANMQRKQAEQERLIAAERSRDFKKKQSAKAAALRAARGGGGVDISTGSELLTAQDFATETEIMKERIRRDGIMRSTRLDEQAALTAAAGSDAASAGKFAAAGSLLKGGIRTARFANSA